MTLIRNALNLADQLVYKCLFSAIGGHALKEAVAKVVYKGLFRAIGSRMLSKRQAEAEGHTSRINLSMKSVPLSSEAHVLMSLRSVRAMRQHTSAYVSIRLRPTF